MNSDKIKVLIIDDSPFARQSISLMISEAPQIEVIGTASSGLEAMRFLEKETPDLITLDLEMPGMNGFTFLKWLMKNNPLPVLVISARSDGQNVFKAIEFGALDFVSKPGTKASFELLKLKEELIRKIEVISKIPTTKIQKQAGIYQKPPAVESLDSVSPVSRGPAHKYPMPAQKPAVVVIGASTGGPAAIQLIASSLPPDFPLPIVIAQHMPPNFTNSFAQRLDTLCKLRVKEAEEGDMISAGWIYVAPGGCHLIARKSVKGCLLSLVPKEESDRYTPSIDKTMISLANLYGGGTLGIILTGMGNDGTEGIKKIKEKGGYAMAESEETAVVYGMPRIPVKLGLIDQVVPVTQVAERMIRICRP